MGTYRLGTKDEQAYIECLLCSRRSFNPNDIKHRYCGSCRMFHVDWDLKDSTPNPKPVKPAK